MRRHGSPALFAPWMLFLIIGFALFIIIVVALSLTLHPLEGTRIYPSVSQGPTTTSTSTTTQTTTTTTQTTQTTTTVPPTTTPVPYSAVNITCPPDVNITIGSSLEVYVTGNAEAGSSNDIARCGLPVVFFSDSVSSISARAISAPDPRANVMDQPQHGFNLHGSRVDSGHYFPQSSQHKRVVTNPSFSADNIIIDPNFVIRAADAPATNSDVSDSQLVGAVQLSTGTEYYVYDTTLQTFLGQFSAAVSFGSDNCTGANTVGQGTVTWDRVAQRWLLLEIGQNASDYQVLCLYLSNSADATGSWTSFRFFFGSQLLDFPRLGVWRDVYSVAINSPTNNICVFDRAAILALDLTPGSFCGTSLSGPLSGFTRIQTWTPMSAQSNVQVPLAVASAGTSTVGAVFMRPHDDEFHDGGITPIIDWLDVEHWTNINFTTSSFISIRYAITTNDFDSSAGACALQEACIPTTNPLVFLDPVREVLMHRLVYVSESGIYASFVSHANGIDVARVKWLHLGWFPPSQIIAPRFGLIQQGTVPFSDGIHRWMSSISGDANGSVILAYSMSNTTVPPTLAARSRLANDPPSQIRDESILVIGPSPSILSNEWGRVQSVSSSTASTFYVNGQTTQDAYTFRLRVHGSIFIRTFTAADNCNRTTCVQIITEQ